jgi:MerR family redox-sensitive transcriptional activator SoxR
MSSELLAIGEVARRSGKAQSAIRYYEHVGLIARPERLGGRRRYPAEVVRTLAVIDSAQRAGLPLEEIRLLLQMSPENQKAVERFREVAARRLTLLTEAIERAEVVRGWLTAAADCCCPSLDDCPLFEMPARLPERAHSLR